MPQGKGQNETGSFLYTLELMRKELIEKKKLEENLFVLLICEKQLFKR